MSRNEFESFLSRIVEFNKRLNFELDESDVSLATNKDDLLKIFQLRSEVYKQVGYSREFPDPIDGMSFDDYDLNSAILYVKKNGEVTGTCSRITSYNVCYTKLLRRLFYQKAIFFQSQKLIYKFL